jgi:protein-L-isoaspartate O-methyltransferase
MNLPILASTPVCLPDEIFDGTGLKNVFELPRQGEKLRAIFEGYKFKVSAIKSVSQKLQDEMFSVGLKYLYTTTERSRAPEPVGPNSIDYAIKSLDVESWESAFQLTGAYELMCQQDRESWTTAFLNREVPAFEFSTVADTLDTILRSKGEYFARRVQYVFRNLSNEHKTNPAHAFNTRLIINCSDGYGGISWRGTGIVSDLRAIISMFIRGELTGVAGTTEAIQRIVRDESFGEWFTFDNGAFRLKIFKKGTIHIDVDGDIAWRLNATLASLYDLALPERMQRKTSTKAKKPRYYELRQQYLSAECLRLIADLKHGVEWDKDKGHGRNRRFLPNTADLPMQRNTVAYRELVAVMEACGGVIKKGSMVEFDYNFVDTVRFDVLRNQCIPEDKSHQFYATQEVEAQHAVEWAEIEPGHDVLEPSAGTGGIAKHLPGNVTCVEVDALRASVLTALGFNVKNADFLTWSDGAPTFDRIVMNPPFAGGRAERHVDAALQLLRPDGILVAIVPTTMMGRFVRGGYGIEWSDEIKDAFQHTGATVRMMKVTHA